VGFSGHYLADVHMLFTPETAATGPHINAPYFSHFEKHCHLLLVE